MQAYLMDRDVDEIVAWLEWFEEVNGCPIVLPKSIGRVLQRHGIRDHYIIQQPVPDGV